ncbi:MAG TPA: DUF2339 domain-containing protein [Ferruginibacter sp.]|nr:DUF2339 domain-containing protein [Ferruginibacter sp.]
MMNADNEKEIREKLLKMQQELVDCKNEIDALKKLINTGSQQKIYKPKQPEPLPAANSLENFVGLKLIHFVGIIILFIGLSIGVKYAIDINLISPTVRIILAYLAGSALLLLSFKLRKKYELFSLILFSGAVATFYFTTYGAYEYYGIISRWLAFVVMLCLTIVAVVAAIKYNKAIIAMLGLVGAYAIPFFVRGNESNINNLLTYILLINLGVLFLSLKKYWLSLNYIAFFSSWVIYFGSLYSDNYDNKFSNSLLLFAILYFVLFTVSTLAFKLFKKLAIALEDAGLLSINTVFFYFALNIVLQRINPSGNENLSLYFSIGLLVAGVASSFYLKGQQYLSSCLYTMSVIALTCFVALHFEGFTITIIWVILAIVLFVAGMVFQQKLFRILSIFLFAITIIKLILFDSDSFTAVQKVIAYIFTGAVLLIVSFLYQRYKHLIFGDKEKNRDL